MKSRYLPWGLTAAIAVLAADQASKWWILDGLDLPDLGSVALLPVLNFTMVWNRGVTFGLLNGFGGSRIVLAAIALAVVAIGGGAVGNVIDRLRFGAVVDFIHAHAFGWSWYVFNVADAAIVCGVAALLLDGLRPRLSPAHDALAGSGGRR
jgi:lipoprotein signal peptidase